MERVLLKDEKAKMTALLDKGVIQEISGEDVPTESHPVKTMWAYAVKTEYGGHAI